MVSVQGTIHNFGTFGLGLTISFKLLIIQDLVRYMNVNTCGLCGRVLDITNY